jgi:REP element-mobilizing transposase RayT
MPQNDLPPPDASDRNPLIAGLHFRGKLPHLKKEGAIYFVTFRLADSLPASEIARLKHDRAAILETARAAKRPLTWHEDQELLAWYCDKVEALLDAGRGACWLSRPDVAGLVADSLRYFDGDRYLIQDWVIMPNHVHAIVWPKPGHTLSQILHSWKSFTSTKANHLLNRAHQDFWQTESFDHWIRDDAERVRLAVYIRNNPVKAAFCKTAEEWPWSSATA